MPLWCGLNACPGCSLGTSPGVKGEGPIPCRYAVIGEAPGYHEQHQGRPFVGPAGKELGLLLSLAGLRRDEVYITNTVACRPPGNRVPSPDERAACRPRLMAELAAVEPDVIFLLGATAIAEFLPGVSLRLYHGLAFSRLLETRPPTKDWYGGTEENPYGLPMERSTEGSIVVRQVAYVPMYHPAAGLHQPGLRGTMADDWAHVVDRLATQHQVVEPNYRLVDIAVWDSDIIAVDTESNMADGSLVAISVSGHPGKADVTLSPRLVLPDDVPVLMHNAKWDIKVLAKEGLDITKWRLADTMIAAYLVGEPQLGLKPLALKRLGVEMTTLRQLLGDATNLMMEGYLVGANARLEPPSGKRKLPRLAGKTSLAKSLAIVMSSDDKAAALSHRHDLRDAIGQPPVADVGDIARLMPERLRDYACADADMTLRLWSGLVAEMEAKGVTKLFWDVEMPLVPVLARMEQRGLAIDREEAARLLAEFEDKAADILADVRRQVGDFNPASRDEVAGVLYDILGLPVLGYTDTGKPTTARWAMETLAEDESIVEQLLQWRRYVKLVGTYLRPWLVTTGRIHTDFNQVRQASDEEAWGATATGRLSSSRPNFQNVPVRTPEGRAVRNCVVAEAGRRLVSIDDSQIELVIMAIDAGDTDMLAAFGRGDDIHAETAKLLFEVDKPTSDQRFVGKTINFAWGYGIRRNQLARTLTVQGRPTTSSEAQRFLEVFETRRPRLKARWREVVDEATRLGYATTLWGRRRYLPALKVARNESEWYEAAKQAYSHRIQGSAADLSKVALVAVDKAAPDSLIAAIHDERLLEVDDLTLGRISDIVEAALIAVRRDMPYPDLLRMSVKVGERWGDLKEVENAKSAKQAH